MIPIRPESHYYVTRMNNDLDSLQIRKHLRRAERTYADYAIIQREITTRVLSRLQYIKHTPQRILDLSLHTCDSEVLLRKAFARASYINTAPILTSLQAAKRLFRKPKSVCTPLDRLPFSDNSVDFVFMSLRLMWTQDWPLLLRECYRVLQPQGMLLFTTLGPDTLQELRAAFAAVDDRSHVHSFVDMHDIGDALVHSGFENPVMDSERVQMHYASLSQLTTDLKKTGANNSLASRSRSLMTPRQWQRVQEHYPKLATAELCATFEFVYGHAWVGEHKRYAVDPATQDILIPVSQLRSSKKL